MTEPDTTKDVGVAFYLIGHGPYRQPRLIELQYLRILRYRKALGGRYDDRHTEPEVFIDLNFPRIIGDSEANKLDAFMRLWKAVREKQYSVVYLDLEEGTSFKRDEYTFIRSTLEHAGARVLNAFYDDEHPLQDKLSEMYGDAVAQWELTTMSDVVNFFPALAGDIIATALNHELALGQDNGTMNPVRYRIQHLLELNPYAANRHPFIEERLRWQWATRHRQGTS